MKQIIFSLILLFFVSCKPKLPQLYEDTVYDTKSTELVDLNKEFLALIDSGWAIRHRPEFEGFEEYYQEKKNSTICKIQSDEDAYKATYAKYDILRNRNNKIIYIKMFRLDSCFGGENAVLTYISHFDYNGNLVIFEKEEDPFQGIPDGCGYFSEKSEYSFNKEHTLLKKTFDLYQGEKKVFSKDCKKNIPIDYKIYLTVDEFLSNNKFDNN
jgi:hypothetical protein